MTHLFLIREQTARKSNPEEESESKTKETSSDGTLPFSAEDYLSAKRKFFSSG